MNAAQDPPIPEAIRGMVVRIARRFDPEKIILFGSHARGTATFDSDADLLVVMNFDGSRRSLAAAIDLEVADRTIPLDLVVATPQEIERDRERVGTIIRPALQEGIVLYERAA